ncbi:RagB/SusD family nutrient uptake outer membrane protein [Chitinophaga sp. Cy-1792]|uniref:RagB/SusD family nutrient uptake outer membrane protein n=1 Tax=Chitinophaga sp. Cy-1792 TaxID=2608339 RepID=UPI001422BD15|nr:RagB/SusD family nutrient uptake outer membrane protein [Chitinophaga sp. Cy-1792]NIG53086.1 RagB/SusD family nutrient uptake outer membrane protein [Chitinophaga sp. Cy-1792]
MKRYITLSLIGALVLGACSKNFTDPSGPSSTQVFQTRVALTDAAVGLQAWYVKDRGGLIYNTVCAGSLLTGETYVTNSGNTDEAQLAAGGGNVLNTNVVVGNLWSVTNKIIFDANNILAATPTVVPTAADASGILAYAYMFKAMSIGIQGTYWTQVPDTTGRPDTAHYDVHFIPAQQGFEKAVGILNNAINVITANPPSASFSQYVPAGINLLNTLYALKARYALYAGQYDVALAAAGMVDLTVKSTFNFNTTVTNPIYTLATSTGNIFQTVDSTMGLPVGFRPDIADKRILYYMLRKVSATGVVTWTINGYYNSTITAIPVYLPGEVTLIKAECYARQGDISDGLTELNKIVTKQPASDPFGIGAGLTAVTATSQAQLLDLIYKHRRIELFMAGQELIDSRRFGRPDSERKRSYFPYPFVERNDDPNTPNDPSF